MPPEIKKYLLRKARPSIFQFWNFISVFDCFICCFIFICFLKLLYTNRMSERTKDWGYINSRGSLISLSYTVAVMLVHKMPVELQVNLKGH